MKRDLNTRKEAMAMGLKTYYTGIPCVNGHLSQRDTAHAWCMQCQEERAESKRKNNRGKKGIRIEMREKGEEYYFSGVPCVNGHTSKRSVHNSECIECRPIYRKKYAKVRKFNRLFEVYKINETEYQNLIRLQNNKCKICLNELKSKSIHIDHCHETSLIRGVLCSRCNQAIGLLKDNLNSIERAYKYVKFKGEIECI